MSERGIGKIEDSMTNELAQNETARLKQCEKAIEKGLGTFVEVGQALLDIRDGKLYRASHKTFDAYCKERWDIGKSHAYRLIEGARTVQAIANAAGAGLSPIGDKISEGVARELKDDPVGAASEIIDRANKGEAPAEVAQDIASRKRTEKERAREANKAKQAEHDASRDQHRESLPEQVKASIAAKDAAIDSRKGLTSDDDELPNRIEELKAINDSITVENIELKEKIGGLEPMRLEYERGGFAEVIKGMAEQIRVLKTRVADESQEKVANLRAMDFWKKKAIELGYSRNAVIDLETLEEIPGHG